MEYIDARRLTGPNLISDKAGTILEIGCESSEADDIIANWERLASQMIEAMGWPVELGYKKLDGGVSLVFSAPIDVLYAATEIQEWIWRTLSGEEDVSLEDAVEQIRQLIAEEENPALLALQKAAEEHQVPFLWDDDEVSLGFGASCVIWPFRELPPVDDVTWSAFKRIPTGMVTGTNGKTTSVRIAKHILSSCGLSVGVSCTDWIAIDDHIIEEGDWSGPGGARAVLRQTAAESALLESARGGLLRRGLGIESADAALITNIAEDHLGDYGSKNLDELLNIKWVVSHSVKNSGTLVLNADDSRLVAQAEGYTGRIVWFSLDANNYMVASHDGVSFVADNDALVILDGSERIEICQANEIPITLNGAARHNVANALAAAALTHAMGCDVNQLKTGLTSMTQEQNPGRCNVYEVEGVNVLVDFAHNPHAMQALFGMAKAIPANRRLLAFGQAGDRPDDLIQELAEEAWSIGLERVHVSELAAYHRGREHGEVFKVINRHLQSLGGNPDQIEHFEEEVDALSAALEWAKPGDLIIMLALGDRHGIMNKLGSA